MVKVAVSVIEQLFPVRSDCTAPFYASGVNRTCVETCPANEFGNHTSGQCEPCKHQTRIVMSH